MAATAGAFAFPGFYCLPSFLVFLSDLLLLPRLVPRFSCKTVNYVKPNEIKPKKLYASIIRIEYL